VGRPEWKRPLGTPGHRWEDIQQVGWGMEWIGLALDRDRWLAVEKLSDEPYGS
jgi:hypothetical protein